MAVIFLTCAHTPLQNHFALAAALGVPTFIIITKIDVCGRQMVLKALEQVTSMIKSPRFNKIPVIISSMDDVIITGPKFVDQVFEIRISF